MNGGRLYPLLAPRRERTALALPLGDTVGLTGDPFSEGDAMAGRRMLDERRVQEARDFLGQGAGGNGPAACHA